MTWEYIAGFFDGEGTIAHNGNGYRVVIPQTNLEVLEEIHAFTGIGHVSQVTKRKSHWKDAWIYYIAKQEHVLQFIGHVDALLIVKKNAAECAIADLIPEVERQQAIVEKRRQRLSEAKALREEGLTFREIGSRIGLNWSYVRRALLKTN